MGVASYNYVNSNESEWECVWWLRSPLGNKNDTTGNTVRSIQQTGYISIDSVSVTCNSVVPALWVE
ncbi:MAG: hypothetical protein IJU92_04755 [Spirochaetaceae bacterium]|nr:hypothetical protein [Spirochaetaceae bacterium]